MPEKKVKGNVEIHRAEASKGSGLDVNKGIMVVITQAFCPNGHNLVTRDDVLFDGHPGICVHVDSPDWSGDVMLSPIHGDHSRIGADAHIPLGTVCRLSCPVCGVAFPRLGTCRCDGGGELVGFFLRPDLNEGDMVAVCSVMGCYRSRIMDQFELLSEFVASQDD